MDTETSINQKMASRLIELEHGPDADDFVKAFLVNAKIHKWSWANQEINEKTVRVTISGLISAALNVVMRSGEVGGNSCSTGRIMLTFHWNNSGTFARLTCDITK